MESGTASSLSFLWQLLPKTPAKENEVRHGGKILRNSLQEQFCSELCHLLAPEWWSNWDPLYRKYMSWIPVWSVAWLHLYSRICS